LHEPERCRLTIHDHRLNRHVRAAVGVDAAALEVEAELGQALRGPVGEHHVVARQELVRRGVVDHVHVGVQARVAASATPSDDLGPAVE
jgi:hypothetical protein